MTEYKHPDNVEIVKFLYMNHTVGQGGELPHVVTAHACWHYCKTGMIHLRAVDTGATYVGDHDTEWGLDRILHATKIMYEIESTESIFQHMRAAKAEAFRCGLPWDDRLHNPVSHERKGSVILAPDANFARHVEATRNRHGDNDNESE